MPVTPEHEALISYVDEKVKKILWHGGDNKAVLISIYKDMDDLKKIILSYKGGELDKFYEK